MVTLSLLQEPRELEKKLFLKCCGSTHVSHPPSPQLWTGRKALKGRLLSEERYKQNNKGFYANAMTSVVIKAELVYLGVTETISNRQLRVQINPQRQDT